MDLECRRIRRRRVWETVTSLESVLALGAASTITTAIAAVVLARLGSSTLKAGRVGAGQTFAALECVGAGCPSIGEGTIAVIELTRLLFAALEAGSVGVGRAGTVVEVASSTGCVPVCHLTTPQVAFGLVATLVNICRLSIAVLYELMQRTSKLKPQHSVKRNIDFASESYARVPGKYLWPTGQAALIAPSAIRRAPSWVEYYRVQRPLFLLQLALELRSHAPWLAWGIPGASSESREWSVAGIVSLLPLGHDTAPVAKVLGEVVAARAFEPSEEPQDDVIGTAWPHVRSAVRARSDGRRILSQLMGSRHAMLTRVMLDEIMNPGLMIWNRERLCDLGLMDEPRTGQAEGKWWENEDKRPQMSEDEIWFAWYSVGYGPP
ncbi:hypothetical protein BGZ61DRAFT_538478 [Ilyonectria robusta]|uniref:uncharacterized protein n=1 Tax=Ilyonectria robusta TaxID=1079257 RepID=UPI001E8D1B1A|nr:uncharacterized protein BGZ61DRAFT_538478 [Ilyonectria robusta]KAH8665511.1 hypothetical protein BGZ61DRAFT_538478 [Ilyonectria robusta]